MKCASQVDVNFFIFLIEVICGSSEQQGVECSVVLVFSTAPVAVQSFMCIPPRRFVVQ